VQSTSSQSIQRANRGRFNSQSVTNVQVSLNLVELAVLGDKTDVLGASKAEVRVLNAASNATVGALVSTIYANTELVAGVGSVEDGVEDEVRHFQVCCRWFQGDRNVAFHVPSHARDIIHTFQVRNMPQYIGVMT